MQTARQRFLAFLFILIIAATAAATPKAGYAQVESRGSVDLFADTSAYAVTSSPNYNPALAAKLQRFAQDLTGDGWNVIFHGVARDPGINAAGVPIDRGASVRALKAQIYSDYHTQQGTSYPLTAVILFGHVPQPYSGDTAFDGDTSDHRGAWSCDAYYGDVSDFDSNVNDPEYPDLNWTDSTVNDITADDPRNYNVPGDGKFDNSSLPDAVTLEVGRIDFDSLPAFSETESQLLAQYLDKDHAYRLGYISAIQQARVYDINDPAATGSGVQTEFNDFYGSKGVIPGLRWPWNGLPNGLPIPNPLPAGLMYFSAGDLIYQDLTQGSFQSNEMYGDGYVADVFTRAVSFPIWPPVGPQNSSVVNTTLFAANDPHSMIYLMGGGDVASAGDWQINNDLLRAAIATPTYSLESIWANGPSFASMATGSEIGKGLPPAEGSGAGTEIALMGDPTIRLNSDMPPSGAFTTPDAVTANAVDITFQSAYPFDASADLIGYYLYSSASANGPFNKLNESGSNPTGIIPVPPTFTPDLSSGSGSIQAGTYYAAITYTGINGTTSFETEPGTISANGVLGQFKSIAVGNNSSITCAGFVLPAGATGANLYISSAEGGTLYFQGKFAISAGNAQAFTLTTQPVTTGTAAPTGNICVDTTASTTVPTNYEVRAIYYQYSATSAYAGTENPPGNYTNISQGDFASYNPAGQYPTVKMATPQNFEQANGGFFNITDGTSFTAPATLTLSAQATAFGGKTVAQVQFYQGGKLIDTVVSPPPVADSVQGPWQYQLTNPPGTYVFSAVVTDSAGLTSTSNTARVYVYSPASFYDFDASTYEGYVSEPIFPATTGSGLNTGWWDNTGTNTGMTTSYGAPSIGLNAAAVGVQFTATTPPLATYVYTVGHSPIDTSVYYGATFSVYLFNYSTSASATVTVTAPLHGQYTVSKTLTLPVDTLVAGTPFPWTNNVRQVTIPLSPPVGTEGMPQSNFDGFSITAPVGTTIEYDEAGLNLPGDPPREDNQPTASFADFLLDTPIQNGYIFWASTNPTTNPPIDGINLRVDAADNDSSIAETDFYLGGNFIGYGTIIPPSAGNESYSNVLPLTPPNIPFGPNTIQATAIDGLGNPVSTATIPVNIDNLFGLVTDQSGNPLPTATITVAGSSGSTTINDVTPTITGADAGSLYTYTDLTIVAVGATTSQVSSVNRLFQMSDVGSALSIPTGQTGFNQGIYIISSVDINHVATLSGIAGTLGSTGGTATITLSGTANYSGGFSAGKYTLTASDGAADETLTYTATLSATSSLRHDFVLLPAASAAPQNLMATPGYQEITLSWGAVANAATYNVYRGTTSGGESTIPIASNVATSPYVDNTPPLLNGTTYYYTVGAVDLNGNIGPLSKEVSATTEPPAPVQNSAVGGVGEVTLSWNAALGATSYNIYDSTSSGTETKMNPQPTITGTSSVVSGLQANTTYYFTITAVNAGGESPQSNEESALTGPAPPMQLTATGGYEQVALTWSMPTGAATYEIFEGTTSGGETLLHTPTITATNYTVTGLADGTTYYFTVSALNSGGGVSAQSSEKSAITLAAGPTNLIATGGLQQVVLTWTGATGATGYNVYFCTSGGTITSKANIISPVTTTTFTASGLENGTTYYFVVTSIDASGEDTAHPSAIASATTTPGAPTGLLAHGGINQIVLNWTTTPGAATYNVYQGSSPGGESATPIKTGLTTPTYTVTALANDTTYYFTVAAVNTAGTSPMSNEASALTAPAAPTKLTATTAYGPVNLSWTGSVGAVSYNVYMGTSAGGELTTPIKNLAATSYVVTGLTPGTTYYFKVTAVNAGAESAPSNEASVTTATLQVFPKGWSFFSMPYDFSAYTFNQLFGPLNTGTVTSPVPPDANRSHVDVWQPNLLEYVVDPTAPADGFHLGQGYWVNLLTATTVTLTAPLPATTSVSLELTEGWNMIGVPCPTGVNLDALTFTSPSTDATELFAGAVADGFVGATLYGYNNGTNAYTPVTAGAMLQPWQAYWVYVLGNTTMTIPTNIGATPAIRK